MVSKKIAKRNKFFNEIYNEIIVKYNFSQITCFTKQIELFKEQVESVLESFIECNQDSLNKIDLLKEIKSVKDIKDWSIFHNLYFISVGNENLSKDVLEKSKKNRSNNETIENKNTTNPLGSLSNLTNIMSDPMMMSMVSSILPIVQKAFAGKENDINITDLLKGLTTKDPSLCGGIDIENLIKESTEKINEIVEKK